jgi:methyl-accepting chemotaxis protein
MSTDNRYSLDSHYRRSDRLMVGVNWLLLVIAVGLAGWYDTWTQAFLIGLPAALVPTAMLFLMPGTRISRATNGAAFMIFAALHIDQAHGMIEMHFGIFVLLAFLLYYRDWLPIVVAAGVIAVHHLSFNYLQAAGMDVWVFDSRTGLDLVLIHAGYVVFETALLVYMALQGHKEAVQAAELHEIAPHLAVVDGRVDLSFRAPDAKSPFALGFNEFMSTIHGAVSKAQNASNQLSAASEQLAELTVTAREGSALQQRETDQVAAAMQEMTHTVQSVADSASKAANDARDADDAASNGSQVVSRSISVINRLATEVEEARVVIQKLEDESNNIGSVLDVIKGIAEQTNLLALNAAIEAARAGEQGRGFAVVADEVRTLASRTQQSTAEIQGMIERLQSGAKQAVAAMEDGTTQARDGVSQVEAAGEALSTITKTISVILDMNTHIAQAAVEQSTVSEEINRNIANISTVAHDTAQGVSATTLASEELHELAIELAGQVGKFKV